MRSTPAARGQTYEQAEPTKQSTRFDRDCFAFCQTTFAVKLAITLISESFWGLSKNLLVGWFGLFGQIPIYDLYGMVGVIISVNSLHKHAITSL